MEVVTYDTDKHTSQGYIWENATAFTVWSSAWTDSNLLSSDKAIVKAIRMAENERRRAADTATSDAALTVETAFEAEVNDSFAALRAIPRSRRVLFPSYLQDDGVGGRDLANFNTTKNYTLTKMTIAGVNWDSPYQYVAVTNSQTNQARKLFKRYVNACEQNNAHFSFISDDMEAAMAAWSIGSVRNTTGAVDSAWESPGDARLIKTLVQDSRFDNLVHGDLTRSKTWRQLLEDYYQEITGSFTAYTTIMAPWTAVTTATGWVTPWATPNTYWAWQAMLRQITETHRIEHIFKYAMDKDWFEGTYDNFEVSNLPYSSWKHLKDMNGHKSYGGLGHTHSKYRSSPVLYGQISGLTGGGIRTTPGTTDDYLFTVQSSGGSVTSYDNDTYLAFIMDVQKCREHAVANPMTTFSPWVRPPDDALDNCKYPDDERYWYEMIFHAALHGARPFHYFNANGNGGQLQDALREIKEITKNGVLWPCNNYAQDPSEANDPLNLTAGGYTGTTVASTKGIVSSAKIMTGPLKGRFIARATVAPTPTGGTGGTSAEIIGDTTLTANIPSTQRGCWLLHDGSLPPYIFSTTGI